MRLTYTHEALRELADAVKYYRACRDGLGREFYHRIEAAEEDIINDRKRHARPPVKGMECETWDGRKSHLYGQDFTDIEAG